MRTQQPQPGPQTDFHSSPADILIYGGGAGGGKSWSICAEPARHSGVKGFGASIFRRITREIKEQGGLWDESENIYYAIPGADPVKSALTWNFESGAKIKFNHLEHEKTVYSFQGAQFCYIGFDELTHFTKKQFIYMLSRNRSTCGVRPYVRATCNPDPDSWVAEFISWWINQDEDDEDFGFPIMERSGVLRWFIRIGNDFVWGDSRQELIDKYETDPDDPVTPKSVTFIPASYRDNKILMQKDPDYIANLNSLGAIDRARLKDGNWKVRAGKGKYFRRTMVEVIEESELPDNREIIRYWDRAATEDDGENDPDWTVGTKMSRDARGIIYIEHVTRFQESPGTVEVNVKNTASQDGDGVTVGIERDPGSAGKFEADHYVRELAGYHVFVNPVTKDKLTRFKPFSTQAEHGNVKVVRGSWNNAFFDELEAFPDTKVKDDQVDTCSGGFQFLTDVEKSGDMKAEMAQEKERKFRQRISGDRKW